MVGLLGTMSIMWSLSLVLFLSCIILLLQTSDARAASSTKKATTNNVPVKTGPVTRLNVDILPPLKDVLEELGFTPYLRNFVRMGVTETRLLLKLSSMDFQIMSMEWDDFASEKVTKLKDKIKDLTKLATVIVEPIREDLIARNKTIYGRMYMPNGVSSIEFNVASFGGHVPMGELPLQMAETLYECPPPEKEETDATSDSSASITTPAVTPTYDNVYHNHLVVVVRGNCTFLQKALLMKAKGARGMLVVNTEDKLESLASGMGINKTVTEKQIASLGPNFFIVAVSNNSYLTLTKSMDFAKPSVPKVHLVPLKCAIGGSCAPLTPEEKQLQPEVSWGTVTLSTTENDEKHTFEFLTSNYGAPLPTAEEALQVDSQLLTDSDQYSSAQRLLCAPISSPESVAYSLESNTSFLEVIDPVPLLKTRVLVAERGGCSFDTKSFHAQQAGYRLLILINTLANQPLQRLGGINPSLGRVGIPTILVLPEMLPILTQQKQWQMQVQAARDDSAFDRWVEVTYSSAKWTSSPLNRALQFKSEEEREAQEMLFHRMVQKMQGHETLVRWLEQQLHLLSAAKEVEPSVVKQDL